MKTVSWLDLLDNGVVEQIARKRSNSSSPEPIAINSVDHIILDIQNIENIEKTIAIDINEKSKEEKKEEEKDKKEEEKDKKEEEKDKKEEEKEKKEEGNKEEEKKEEEKKEEEKKIQKYNTIRDRPDILLCLQCTGCIFILGIISLIMYFFVR